MAMWNQWGATIMNVENAPVELAEIITARLQHRLGCRVRNVRVRLENGGLVLQGHATTYYAKQLAQHFAMETSGLPILVNEIEVR